MMRYGGSDQSLSANFVLSTDLQPYNRCISKSVAITAEADVDAMNAWEESQDHSLNVIPFPQSRLMSPKAIFKGDPSNPWAELYDDEVLQADWDRQGIDSSNPKRDSWKAGYNYELLSIEFDNAEYASQYSGQSMQVSSSGGQTTYTRGWAKIIVNEDSLISSDPWQTSLSSYYSKLDPSDAYMSVGQIIAFYDTLGVNTGSDRSVTLSWRATPIQGIIDHVEEGFKCVQPNRTHTEFQTKFYHFGQTGEVDDSWVSYDANSTSSITINYSPLDIAVVFAGSSTNGTYWDANGWHHASQTSDLANAISVSKSGSGSSVTIDFSIIKSIADASSGMFEAPIYIYGCWDQMSQEGNHLVASSGSSATISASGMQDQTISIISAGNLNKTEEESSIRNYYTCLHKVHWKTGQDKIKVMALGGADSSYDNVGVYGQIYPDSNFSRSENQNDLMRNYTASSSVVSSGSASVSITSTVNGSNAGYTVSQYFPVGSENYHETFTVNGQSLTDSNSISVSAGGNLSVNFGSISSGQARWLKLQQNGSPEFANLCFTFN